ncbi:hypothetical protein [Tenacibaculum soleae]|uniref:hypothetical protein n=1 Tax=Tenacibaculum soleae TaxID=447689 RepID=UPI0026E1A8AA|nr:hypothetical protein [Tenacibaculum soleae]MDO6813820.1 hypothetical protein [Tenacibaculum soleae]
MKTEYSQEIKELLSSCFTPVTAEDENAQPKTLEEIHAMVITVLPAKWVYDTDVYTALQSLNFKTSLGKKEEAEGLYYFVIPKV